jgi:hypothetical protein
MWCLIRGPRLVVELVIPLLSEAGADCQELNLPIQISFLYNYYSHIYFEFMGRELNIRLKNGHTNE